MARVTVEDCMDKLDSRFELVTIASYRAKEINKGAKSLVENDNDKNAVLALREIASEKIDPQQLKEKFIQTLRRDYNPDLIDEEPNDNISKEASEEVSSLEVSEDDSIVVENYMFDDEVEAED
ncbi:MAG: DNA-directed RNA polymerase subunit omega [Rickettsiales bacterium]